MASQSMTYCKTSSINTEGLCEKHEFCNVLTGPCESSPEQPAMTFAYEPDNFQRHAFLAIAKGQDVLVTAHTGSGKTAVAEYAIMETIRKAKTVIYTSPIKTLSNEKFNDFRKKFNPADVSLGIMTGDNKINPNGNCVIMTAEILRNALYKLKNKNDAKSSLTEQFDEDFVDRIGCVIMDEIHFINSERGNVWEETLILLNHDVQLIMLSATIDKADEFAQWVGNTRKKVVNLIPTTHRVVPLYNYIYVPSPLIPNGGNGKLYQIMDQNNVYSQAQFIDAKKQYELKKEKDAKKNKNLNGIDTSMVLDLTKYLKEKEMLPVIFFSFSKKNCELYASMIQNEPLIDSDELHRIDAVFSSQTIQKYDKDYGKLEQYVVLKALIRNGIAFHHSGLLPILKEIVEMLFKEKLIKVLFATETFAIGVNAPTKTVVFCELEKHTEQGKRFLKTDEFRQAQGRAGRRGQDPHGNVIILPIFDFPDGQELQKMMTGKSQEIKSRFKIDYQFITKSLCSNSTKVANIKDFMKNSLYFRDVMCGISGTKRELTDATNLLDSLYDIGYEQYLTDFKKLYDLDNNKINSDQNFGITFTLSKSQQKEQQKLKKLVNDVTTKDLYKKYCQYMKALEKKNKLEKDLNDNEQYIDSSIDQIIQFLQQNNYLTEMNEILPKCIIASKINETNPILLTEMIMQSVFEGLSSMEIIGLLAIFIEPERKNEEQGIMSFKGTPLLHKKIKKINEIIQNMTKQEYNLGINIDDREWNISYESIDMVMSWAQNDPLKDTLSYIPEMHLGSFIKNIIKINNLTMELINAFKFVENIDIIPELVQIEPLIIRDFVNVNSLYLS